MDIEKLSHPLGIENIDFRIQSINNGGYATILAYKDARVDMQRLDDVCTPLGWKREHVRDNRNCIVSVWSEDLGDWVSKEDTGTESNTEQAKGLASDSFKRACFNWGIGRELYDYPMISIKLDSSEIQETGQAKPKYRATWGLKIKDWTWISEFTKGKITALACKDDKGTVRFNWGKFKAVK